MGKPNKDYLYGEGKDGKVSVLTVMGFLGLTLYVEGDLPVPTLDQKFVTPLREAGPWTYWMWLGAVICWFQMCQCALVRSKASRAFDHQRICPRFLYALVEKCAFSTVLIDFDYWMQGGVGRHWDVPKDG